jgi:hypothetical protein
MQTHNLAFMRFMTPNIAISTIACQFMIISAAMDCVTLPLLISKISKRNAIMLQLLFYYQNKVAKEKGIR